MNYRPIDSESMHSMPQTLRARWVFPVDGPPLENGTIEVAEGRIAAVHKQEGPITTDLGNAAVIPGLVNAHTHLELSDVAAPLEPALPFTSWLDSVIGHRRLRGAEAGAALTAAIVGADESLRTGTTLVGDIVSRDWSAGSTSPDGPYGVAFLELLGLTRERVAQQCEVARRHLERGGRIDRCSVAGDQLSVPVAPREAADWSAGISPHAPYSVHPELFAKLVELAVEFQAPLATHLAETRSELQLLEHGSGEFVDFLARLGVWQPSAIPRGTRPLDYLRMLAPLPRSLVVHGNYLSDEEIEFLAECPGASVVYCPRTHVWFGHEPHPWRAMLARGINVAVGTDSRASSPDLSVWKELTFVHRRQPDLSPATVLELGTIRGARALGQGRDSGSVSQGKRADLAVVSLPAMDAADPYALLFHPASSVTGVMCAGRWVVGSPSDA
jgi:cytosine/adenosine deaminase-related metal-dependent hydrolase